MFEITIENGAMNVAFEGALDTGNSASTQEQLLATISANKITSVILDLNKLNYVSSAGLRVLFKIKQHVANTTVINASLAVYEVFDISGLTQLMDVNKSMQEMNIEGGTITVADGTGTRYRIDEDTVIKVYLPDIELEQIEEEIILVQSAFAFGAGNSITFDIGRCGDSYATKLTYRASEAFADALERNPEEFEEQMDKYFDAFTHFAQAEYPEEGFDSIQDVLHKRIRILENRISPEESAVLHELADALKDGYDLIHGDMTPMAFSVLDGELALSYKSELAIGPAIYDVYCLQRFFTYAADLPKEHVKRTMSLTPAMNARVQDAFYARYFEGECEEDVREKRAKIDLASTLEKYLFLATKSEERIDELADLYNDIFLRDIIVPRKDEIANLLATL